MKPRLFEKKSDNNAAILANTDCKLNPYEVLQQKPITELKETSTEAFENSKNAAISVLPTVTATGLNMMFNSRGDYAGITQFFGFFVAVSGLILDPLKAPIAAIISLEEAIRGSVTGIGSLITEGDPQDQQVRQVYKSFIEKMNETANLLIIFKLEEQKTLHQKIKSGDIEELIGMTLLYTAYHSRYHQGILLSSEKVLTRENCPRSYLKLFDTMCTLQELVRKGLGIKVGQYAPSEAKSLEDAEKVIGWIKYVKEGKKLETNDFAHHIVNSIIDEIKKLRELALENLPEDVNRAAYRINL